TSSPGFFTLWSSSSALARPIGGGENKPALKRHRRARKGRLKAVADFHSAEHRKMNYAWSGPALLTRQPRHFARFTSLELHDANVIVSGVRRLRGGHLGCFSRRPRRRGRTWRWRRGRRGTRRWWRRPRWRPRGWWRWQ